MGYSLAIQCRSAKLKTHMLSFLKREFRGFNRLLSAQILTGSVPEFAPMFKEGQEVKAVFWNRQRTCRVEKVHVVKGTYHITYDLVTIDEPNAVFRETRNEYELLSNAEFKARSKYIDRSSDDVRFVTDDLSYDHGKNLIGFDYSRLSGAERHYIYSVLAWAAIKVGKTPPAIRYDGEATRLNVGGLSDEKGLGCTELGFLHRDDMPNPVDNHIAEAYELTVDNLYHVIEAELKRLESVYKAKV